MRPEPRDLNGLAQTSNFLIEIRQESFTVEMVYLEWMFEGHLCKYPVIKSFVLNKVPSANDLRFLSGCGIHIIPGTAINPTDPGSIEQLRRGNFIDQQSYNKARITSKTPLLLQIKNFKATEAGDDVIKFLPIEVHKKYFMNEVIDLCY